MARTNYLKLALVIALTMAATSAYSATTISGTTNLSGSSFSCSNKVDVAVATDATGSAYSARAKHLNGDKVIATVNADAKLYWKTRAVGSSVDAAAVADVFTDTATWTSM